jgi:3-aminobutyryl-CoA ammonia-lyase
MRFISANHFFSVCDCKDTHFSPHGEKYFASRLKLRIFANTERRPCRAGSAPQKAIAQRNSKRIINNQNIYTMAVTSMLRVRMSAKDAHYGGNLVDGAHMVHLFGDVATELLIKQDGDEGLFCAYDMVEFKAPVYAGDYIEAYGEITHVGNTSRKMKFEAYKVIRTLPEISASAAEVLEERILVCRATGTCVTPKECQRYNK